MGAVTSQMSTATGVSEGHTMTTSTLQGATKVVKPAAKLKGTSMVFGSVRKLTKKMKGGKKLWD